MNTNWPMAAGQSTAVSTSNRIFRRWHRRSDNSNGQVLTAGFEPPLPEEDDCKCYAWLDSAFDVFQRLHH